MSDLASSYIITDLLGVGGMGEVFGAKTTDGREVAIKVLAKPFAKNPMMIARARSEAAAARRVVHPNVVRIVEDGMTDDGEPYIVMARAAGRPLGLLVKETGPLPFPRIRTIARQLLAALQAIHEAGLVHGDVKSDNVMVDADDGDRVTVIDFGLASPSGTETNKEMVSGTPEYMAPEQVRGEGHTARSDLYAVGVILYELTTGSTPFGGGSSTAIFERHLHDDVVAPALRCPDRAIPPGFEGVIMRALAKDPADRHHDARMFAAAVERTLATSSLETARTIRQPVAVSASAPTLDWTPVKRQRFAGGTVPRDSAAVCRARVELGSATTADAIIVGYLALVDALLSDHRMACAARELEAGIEDLETRTTAPAELWRLLLALAALYDGLGDPRRARSLGFEAKAWAQVHRSREGIVRSNQFLHRVAGS